MACQQARSRTAMDPDKLVADSFHRLVLRIVLNGKGAVRSRCFRHDPRIEGS